MDETTINTGSFTVNNGSAVGGNVTYSNKTATFTPISSLERNKTYTATLSTTITDNAGNHLTDNYTWSFSTAAPEVVTVTPSIEAVKIHTPTLINVTFSEDIDETTLSADSFTVTNGSPVSGSITYSNKKATFTPSAELTNSSTYTVTLTTTIKDLAGNHLTDNYTWSFTTCTGQLLGYIAKSTGSRPEAVTIGDVNNDGRNDVVMTTSFNNDTANDYKLFVFLQNASGVLDSPVKYSTSATNSYRPQTVAIGDVNNNGRNDVVIGNSGSGIQVFLQNTSGTLDTGIVYSSDNSHKIRIADLNNDGLLDIAGIGSGTNTASVWLQNGIGTLNSPVTYNVTHDGYDDLEVGDVNNDGLMDIIVMSGQGSVPNLGVLTQKQDGTFNASVYYYVSNPVTANTLTNGVAVGDINGDTLNDVVVTYGGNQPASKIGIFSQNASATLNSVTSYSSYDMPEPVEIADVTGDERKDIIVAHGGWNKVGVYKQNANGTLQSEVLYTIPYASTYNPHGLAAGDINSDGLKDIVIADYNNGLVILYGN